MAHVDLEEGMKIMKERFFRGDGKPSVFMVVPDPVAYQTQAGGIYPPIPGKLEPNHGHAFFSEGMPGPQTAAEAKEKWSWHGEGSGDARRALEAVIRDSFAKVTWPEGFRPFIEFQEISFQRAIFCIGAKRNDVRGSYGCEVWGAYLPALDELVASLQKNADKLVANFDRWQAPPGMDIVSYASSSSTPEKRGLDHNRKFAEELLILLGTGQIGSNLEGDRRQIILSIPFMPVYQFININGGVARIDDSPAGVKICFELKSGCRITYDRISAVWLPPVSSAAEGMTQYIEKLSGRLKRAEAAHFERLSREAEAAVEQRRLMRLHFGEDSVAPIDNMKVVAGKSPSPFAPRPFETHTKVAATASAPHMECGHCGFKPLLYVGHGVVECPSCKVRQTVGQAATPNPAGGSWQPSGMPAPPGTPATGAQLLGNSTRDVVVIKCRDCWQPIEIPGIAARAYVSADSSVFSGLPDKRQMECGCKLPLTWIKKAVMEALRGNPSA